MMIAGKNYQEVHCANLLIIESVFSGEISPVLVYNRNR